MRNPELKIHPTEEDQGTETVALELDAYTARTLAQAALREGMTRGQLVMHMIADYSNRANFGVME